MAGHKSHGRLVRHGNIGFFTTAHRQTTKQTNSTMPHSRHLLTPFLLLPIWAGYPLTAQQPKAAEGTIPVEITALVTGADANKGATDDKPSKQDDKPQREVVWTIQKARYRGITEAKERLDRVASNPANMVPDPATGGRMLASVTIRPGPNVYWREVVDTYDAAMGAGFKFAVVHGIDTCQLTPVALAKPTVDKDHLAMSGAWFCNPDAKPPKLRPTIDVLRDGRIRIGDKQVFAPRKEQPQDLAALRKELRRLRASMKIAQELGQRPGHDGAWIDMPVLLRIDRDARWQNTQLLLKELQHPEVGFWKLHLAVANKSSRLRRTGR